MSPKHLAGVGSIVLGAAVAGSAVLGPLALKVIRFRTSANIEAQFTGGEIVSLAFIAPALAGAGGLWLRGHWLAPAVTIGPALYAVYTYLTVIVGQEYARYPGNVEKFFPLYAGLVAGATVLGVYSWLHLPDAAVPPPAPGFRRALAAIFLGIGGFVALAWTAQFRLVLVGSPPREYTEAPKLFWLIKLLDFGFLIPAVTATGIGLLRRDPLAERAACALAGFSTCLIGSIAGMAIEMQIRDDPSASPPMVIGLVAATTGLAFTTWRLLTSPGPVVAKAASMESSGSATLAHEV